MIFAERNSLFWSFFRAFPFFYLIFLFITGFSIPNEKYNLYEAYFYIFTEIINASLKSIFQKIYQNFDILDLPFIGRGLRPIGANNCGFFLNSNIDISKTFGMPSGHSQFAWTFASISILKIIHENSNIINKNRNKTNNINKIFRITFIILFASLSSYARVSVENCHTTGQVIVGALFGIILGYVGFNLLYKNNYNKNIDFVKNNTFNKSLI